MTNVPAKGLLPGDRIMHPGRRVKEGERTWRHVLTVKAKPSIRPGATHLSCECVTPSGEKVRISLGDEETVDIERKG